VDKNLVIQQTANYAKKTLEGEGSGHDWWHIYRVWQLAKTIGKSENADMFIVELGALLHDIADYKMHEGDEEIGPKTARKWLENLKVDNQIIEQVVYIVGGINFKGAKVKHDIKTIEAQIVFDADKLDALGAIGIARTFAYGGHMDRPIYEPSEKPHFHTSFEEYKTGKSHTINHFYEKLLLLRDFMYTKTAKQIAVDRTKYMEDFLQKFYAEWEGNK
jgi:uncharacterized protein